MTDLENTDSVRSEAVVKTLKILIPGIKHVASIVPGCEGGNNYMCRVYRVQVRFGESEDLQWLFIKVSPEVEGDGLIEWMDYKIAINNECEGYKHLGQLELPMPKFYQAEQRYLVLEDLVSQSYAMRDKTKGYDLAETEFVLEKLAKFHGNSIRLRQEYPSAFHALSSKFEKGRFNFEKIVDYHKYFDKMMEYIGPLEKDVILLMDGYRERKVFALVEEFLKLNLRIEEHALLGLIHGDCWINNIMIRGGGESDKEKVTLDVKFIDLQTVDINSVLVDLTTFLVTSIDLPLLTEHYQQLLKHYHHHLNLPSLSWEQFLVHLDQYKRYFFPLFMFRALPTRSLSSEQYQKNFRDFVGFLRKNNFF